MAAVVLVVAAGLGVALRGSGHEGRATLSAARAATRRAATTMPSPAASAPPGGAAGVKSSVPSSTSAASTASTAAPVVTEPPQQSPSHGLPVVAAVQPSTAAGCTTVTLLGSNLAEVRAVVFGRDVADPTLVSAGSVVVRVPDLGSSPTTVPVQVEEGPVESAATGADVLRYSGSGACETPASSSTKKGK